MCYNKLQSASLANLFFTVSLREIRQFQKATSFLIPKRPFGRLLRQVAQEIMDSDYIPYVDLKWQVAALEALQEAAESYLVSVIITEVFL